jgi:hypothetical protein
MSVDILDASAWREYRGRPSSAGINETTHLAKIADRSGRLRDCFVKLMKPGTPALLCEALGWLLARAAGVQCPDFAAIVLVPVAELRRHGPLPAEFDRAALAPAWCSEIVAGKSVRQVHKMSFVVARAACLRSKDARKIAAFDQWSDLRDRNFGNVIQSSKGGYVAIDHETLLHDLLWEPSGISWTEHSLLEHARKALKTGDFQRFQLDMAAAAKDHDHALKAAQPSVDEIIVKLLPAQAQALGDAIKGALAERSAPGWMSDKLKVIS